MNDSQPELTSVIKRLYRLQAQTIDALLKPFGLARTQYIVLYHLQPDGDMPAAQLQERLQVEGATLSGVIDTLSEKGLVRRVEQAEDKRRKNIVLTDAGNRLMGQIPPLGFLMQEIMSEGLSEVEVERFVRAAEHMTANLEENVRKLANEEQLEGDTGSAGKAQT